MTAGGHAAPRSNRVFGWPVVLGCFIGMLGNVGAVTFGSLGVMIKPLGSEFGWGRGEVSLALTYLTVGIALGIPVAGNLVDRFGARRVAAVSVLTSAAVLLAAPLAVASLPGFYSMIVVLALFGAPTNTLAYVRVISAWFDRNRGLIIGINASGLGLGFALVPLLTTWLVAHWGWRGGYIGLGVVMLVLVLPAVVLLIRDRPQDLGLLPDGVPQDSPAAAVRAEAGLTVAEALRARNFWLIVLMVPCFSFALNGILSQLIPLLTDRGMDPAKAASVVFTMGLSMAVARIVVGYLVDRFFAPYVAMWVFTLSVLGIALLTYGQHPGLSFLAAVFMGFGIGAEADLMAYLVGRYFGLRRFGVLFALVFASYLLGTGLGPYVLGATFDVTGSYQAILRINIGLCAAATMLFALLGPYRESGKTRPAAARPRR